MVQGDVVNDSGLLLIVLDMVCSALKVVYSILNLVGVIMIQALMSREM